MIKISLLLLSASICIVADATTNLRSSSNKKEKNPTPFMVADDNDHRPSLNTIDPFTTTTTATTLNENDILASLALLEPTEIDSDGMIVIKDPPAHLWKGTTDNHNNRLLQTPTCPGVVGEFLMCSTEECTCSNMDLYHRSQSGCSSCKQPNGGTCTFKQQCNYPTSKCRFGVCQLANGGQNNNNPGACPVLLDQSIGCIVNDADCTCSGSTPNKFALQLSENNGIPCHVCHASADGEVCEEQTDCKPGDDGSFCDIGVQPFICTPKSTCPKRNSAGGFFCNMDSTCSCANGGTKTTTTLDGTTCYICYDVEDGDSCSTTTDCSPSSYCDTSTGTCTSSSDCPTINADGELTCITDPNCGCSGTKSFQASLQSNNNPDTTCYICAVPDGEACTLWNDCQPTSRCASDNTCVPDNTCRYFEALSCSEQADCTCPAGRFKRELESTSGGSCFSCQLENP